MLRSVILFRVAGNTTTITDSRLNRTLFDLNNQSLVSNDGAFFILTGIILWFSEIQYFADPQMEIVNNATYPRDFELA